MLNYLFSSQAFDNVKNLFGKMLNPFPLNQSLGDAASSVAPNSNGGVGNVPYGPPMPSGMPQSSNSIMTYVLLGAGALVVISLLRGK